MIIFFWYNFLSLTLIIPVVLGACPAVRTRLVLSMLLQALLTEQLPTLFMLKRVSSHFQADHTYQVLIRLTDKLKLKLFETCHLLAVFIDLTGHGMTLITYKVCCVCRHAIDYSSMGTHLSAQW